MADEMNILCMDKMDRGLAYAESCFETFRIINGHIFLWGKHWQRLSCGMQSFGIHLSENFGNKVLEACLKQSKQRGKDCLARLTISGGDASWGLLQPANPRCYIQTIPFTPNKIIAMHSVEQTNPLYLKTAKFAADYANTLKNIRHWQQSMPNLNPLTYLVKKDGVVLSGLTSNVLLYHDGKWRTPQGLGILAGVVRQYLLDQSLLVEQVCPVSMLETCEALLLTNSGQFIQVVSSIDGRELATKHPAIQKLQDVLAKHPGVNFA